MEETDKQQNIHTSSLYGSFNKMRTCTSDIWGKNKKKIPMLMRCRYCLVFFCFILIENKRVEHLQSFKMHVTFNAQIHHNKFECTWTLCNFFFFFKKKFFFFKLCPHSMVNLWFHGKRTINTTWNSILMLLNRLPSENLIRKKNRLIPISMHLLFAPKKKKLFGQMDSTTKTGFFFKFFASRLRIIIVMPA